MKKHFLPLILGLAGVFAIATAFGTGDEPLDEPEDDGVVLGEEDLAERGEILRNQFRRMTPSDEPLLQDVGTWPAAWEEFGTNWDSAAADREYGAWVVPVELTQENGATVMKDGEGNELWRGTTDFARLESSDVVLTGGLVAEEDWAVYEAVRGAVEEMTAEASRVDIPVPTRSHPTNGLRFTSCAWTTNDSFHMDLAYEVDTNVDLFVYAVAHTSALVVATWTNDENVAITDTNTVWYSVGEPFNGRDSTWEYLDTITIDNGEAEYEDSGFPASLGRLRYYAAAVAQDSDGDELSDGQEAFVTHTAPDDDDSDGDGLEDGDEINVYGTNPTKADTDGDGLNDGVEINQGLDPTDPDMDDDGLNDGYEQSIGTDPEDPDSDHDGLPDGWEVQNGLNPLDDGSTNVANGPDGDPDGDGFSNALEFELDAPADYAAWNGNELAWKLTHFTSTVSTNNGAVTTNWQGLSVNISNAWNCGGSCHVRQNVTTDLIVPDLMACGYYIDLAIEGSVEDQNSGYDKVWFEAATNTFYFEGNDNYNGCSMAIKEATNQVLIFANSHATLRYDTVKSMFHSGAYARVVGAVAVAPFKVEVEGPDCIRVGETAQLIAHGGSGAPYIWESLDPAIDVDSVTGVITAITTGVSCVLATDSSGQCFGGKEITVFDVSLDVEKTLLTLKHDETCNLTVQILPENSLAVQAYAIQIKRSSETDWYNLSHAQALLPWSAKTAGEFHLRGAAKIAGNWHYSTSIVMQVQFPSYEQIIADTAAQTMMESAWARTLNDCTENPNQRREHGFWIILRTRDNTYVSWPEEVGPWTGPDDDATIELSGQPADWPQDPAPNAGGALYPVAAFHTHTPTTYLTNYPAGVTFEVGPSLDDDETNLAAGILGIVYDYCEYPSGSGTIPPGHPKNSPAQTYLSGNNRRELP